VGVDHIDLFISRDNGLTYEPIASLPGNPTSHSWQVTAPGTNSGPGDEYTALFMVKAYDAANNVGTDVSDNPFSLFDLVTSTLLSMFQAAPVKDGVELRWQVGESELISGVALHRAEAEAGPWTVVDAERRVDGGVTVVVDPSAEAGKTYFYRLLASTRSGSEVTLGQLSGTAGEWIKEFALTRVWPNPSAGMARVDFAVAREIKVRLSVLDVQGREVAVLAHGPCTPGRYQATWSGRTEHGEAPVGVYFIRYQVPGNSLVRRLVLAR